GQRAADEEDPLLGGGRGLGGRDQEHHHQAGHHHREDQILERVAQPQVVARDLPRRERRRERAATVDADLALAPHQHRAARAAAGAGSLMARILVPRPGSSDRTENDERYGERGARGASSGGVAEATLSSGATRPPRADQRSAFAGIATPRSRHSPDAPGALSA